VAGTIVYFALTSGPDTSALPDRQDTWCCSESSCFAARELSSLPPCVDIYQYCTLRYGLSEYSFDDEDSGAAVRCDSVLRTILAKHPDALKRGTSGQPEIEGLATNTR